MVHARFNGHACLLKGACRLRLAKHAAASPQFGRASHLMYTESTQLACRCEVPLVPEFSPLGLATSAAAFAAASVCPERLRRALVQRTWVPHWQISSLLRSHQLFLISQRSKEHLPALSAQELVDLQWAMAWQPVRDLALEVSLYSSWIRYGSGTFMIG